MRRRGLLGAVLRSDPVHDILAGRVCRRPSSPRPPCRNPWRYPCAWAATSGEQAVVGWLALIWAAHVFMSWVYCSTDGGLKLDPDQRRDHRQHDADAAGDLLVLRVHVLVHEDQDNQRQEGDQRDDRAELVLEEELGLVGLAGRIVLVGRLPHQAAGDREDRDPDQNADQQRQVAVVELVLVKQDNPGDFAADGDDPRECGENAKARGGGLLALRRTPFLGDVDVLRPACCRTCSDPLILLHDGRRTGSLTRLGPTKFHNFRLRE